MHDLEKIKAERRKELLTILELKKKELKTHFDQSANKVLAAGKVMIFVGAGTFLAYTVFDRYLESKFRNKTVPSLYASKPAAIKWMYPFFSVALQESAGFLFSRGQEILRTYLQHKRRHL